MVVLNFTAARAFFQLLVDRKMTDAENPRRRAQGVAFQIGAFELGEVQLPGGQAALQHPRHAAIFALVAGCSRTVFPLQTRLLL